MNAHAIARIVIALVTAIPGAAYLLHEISQPGNYSERDLLLLVGIGILVILALPNRQ